MSGSTRWSLIDAVRDGDRRAEAQFVARYRPAVQRYLARCGLGAEAEDAAQDVFMRLMAQGALEKAQQEHGSFRSFLFAVTRNVLGHHLGRKRAQKRGGEVQIGALPEQGLADPQERDVFDREWLLHLLELAMGRLQREHPNYFEALRGFVWEQQSQAAMAEALGRSLQDVRNHVHRGRRKLIGYLREEVARYEHRPGQHQTEVEALSRLLGLSTGSGHRST